MKHTRSLLLATLLPLAACSSGTVKDTLGLNRAAPDEFRVVSRPPLSVPPQFNLRPPSASDSSPTAVPASKKAQDVLMGGGSANGSASDMSAPMADTAVVPVTASNPASGSDAEFLKRAGAEKVDPNIREKMVQERIAVQEKKEESSWWTLGTSTPDKKDPLVDAKKEAERIKDNKDTGKPVTTGDTPEVKAKDTGVLGQIFGY